MVNECVCKSTPQTRMTTPVRRSARIAKLNEMKHAQKYRMIAEDMETTAQQTDSSTLQKVPEEPRGYDCKQKSFMIADLTMALINLACIINWIYR